MKSVHPVVLIALMFAATAPTSAAEIVLLDSAVAERSSKVYARLKQEAAAAQQKRTGKSAPLNAEFAEALEMAISNWRAALPEASAEVARAQKADLVLEVEVAKRYGLSGADVTAQIQAVLDQKFAGEKFVAP
jgi:predicted Zn-dependent protease